jgi:hypothetical protein
MSDIGHDRDEDLAWVLDGLDEGMPGTVAPDDPAAP